MERKNIKLIPRGEMCYTADKDGVHYCPYFIKGNNGGVYCAFCDYVIDADRIGNPHEHLWGMVKICNERL